MATLNSQLSNSFVEYDYLDTGVEPISGYEELYNKVYRDYQSFSIDAVLEFCIAYPESLLKVSVPPGMSIEGLAQKLYSDKDYWDLLMVLNNKELLYDLPKSNDLVAIEVEELVEKYFEDYQGPVADGLIEAYKENLLENKTKENLEKQTFIVLNPNYKKQFLRIVKYGV